MVIYGFNANEVFQMAIEIERNGYRFYQKAHGLVDDQDVKDVFARLATDEIEHEKRFIALKSQLPESAKESTIWDPDNETDQYLRMMAGMHVFGFHTTVDDTLGGVEGAVGALKLAIQFEKDSITFFLAMQDATEGKKGRELIAQLIEEEKRHLKELSIALMKHSNLKAGTVP
jgi:rubrerythrin